jgi:hypothetical protein
MKRLGGANGVRNAISDRAFALRKLYFGLALLVETSTDEGQNYQTDPMNTRFVEDNIRLRP